MSKGQARLSEPGILIPFIIVTLIWGSTWIVIRDQLGVVPPTWSITYRYVIASLAMFAFALVRRLPLSIGREGHALAIAFGIPQFFLNFNFVYAAEQYITSGIVAVVFALLIVPNSVLAWLFLGQRLSRRFIGGSCIAVAGVGFLFIHELQSAAAQSSAILIGISLTLLAVLAASIANIMQASDRLRARPVIPMLAWGMFYGTLANAVFASLLYGPPIFEARFGYWLGLVHLGLVASAIAFTLYFGIIRAVGPAPAAYTSLIIPVIAMTFSTIFEGYRWSILSFSGAVLALIGLFIALRARSPVKMDDTLPVVGEARRA